MKFGTHIHAGQMMYPKILLTLVVLCVFLKRKQQVKVFTYLVKYQHLQAVSERNSQHAWFPDSVS